MVVIDIATVWLFGKCTLRKEENSLRGVPPSAPLFKINPFPHRPQHCSSSERHHRRSKILHFRIWHDDSVHGLISSATSNLRPNSNQFKIQLSKNCIAMNFSECPEWKSTVVSMHCRKHMRRIDHIFVLLLRRNGDAGMRHIDEYLPNRLVSV